MKAAPSEGSSTATRLPARRQVSLKMFSTVTALLLTTLALATLTPTAAAVDLYCIEGEPNCPSGQLTCVLYPTQVCVRDPCYTTMCWGTPASATDVDAAATCHHLAHGPGFDSYLCYDVKGPVGCKVYRETYDWETGRTRACIA